VSQERCFSGLARSGQQHDGELLTRLQEKALKCSCFVGHDSADFIIECKNSRKKQAGASGKKDSNSESDAGGEKVWLVC
jgi:hypothetical protein